MRVFSNPKRTILAFLLRSFLSYPIFNTFQIRASVCDLRLICHRLSDHAWVKYVCALRSAFLCHQSFVPSVMDSLTWLKHSSPAHICMGCMSTYTHVISQCSHDLSSNVFAYPEGFTSLELYHILHSVCWLRLLGKPFTPALCLERGIRYYDSISTEHGQNRHKLPRLRNGTWPGRCLHKRGGCLECLPPFPHLPPPTFHYS